MSQAARFGTAYIAKAMRTPSQSSRMMSSMRSGSLAGRRQVISQWNTMQQPKIQSLNATAVGISAVRGFHSSPLSRNVASEVAASASTEPAVTSAIQASIDPNIATQAAMQIGDLAKHGLDTYWPTRMFEYALEFIHVTSGLPWWATIAVSVVAIRAALFPLAVYGQKNIALLNNHKPELSVLMEKQQRAAATGDVITSSRAMQEVRTFYKKRGISPVKGGLAGAASAPFMMALFFALKDLATIPEAQMHTGGLWWFTDLTVPDPYYILPVLSCMGMMSVIELQSRMNSATAQSQQAKIIMRVVGVAMAYFTAGLPADVFMFWVVNNLISLGQVGLFHSAAFRRRFGITEVEKAKFAREPESAMSKLDLSAIMGKKKSTKFVVKHKD
ncbi:hypothetical protein GQ54DRAFT_292176 [Martensiomyces pterosporus]|nr:hypothetical protein GQ54DRAFT_292176 [Martensiomyces pterosporus]